MGKIELTESVFCSEKYEKDKDLGIETIEKNYDEFKKLIGW